MIRIMTDGVIPNTQNKKYIIETASELSQLEAVFGNEAYCVGNETTYICNGSGTYVVKKNVGENELPYVTQSDNGTLLEVADGVWGKGANANEIARVDGHYENLGAGRADQLVSTTFAEDSVPYSFRTSGGSADVGDLEYDEIVGGTIAWNQLIQNGNFVDRTYWSTNKCTPTASGNIGRFTCNSAEYKTWGFYQSPSGIIGHKYLGLGSFRCNTVNAVRGLTFRSSSNRMINVVGYTLQNAPVNDVWYDLSFIGVYNEIAATASCNVEFASTSDITVGTDYIEAKNVMLFDITQMFGPDIADYIYSLEAETTGSGIAYFRKLFPNAYYTTDSGTLMSVKAASHKMIGFNAWDEVWENGSINDYGADSVNANALRSKNYIKVIPGEVYNIRKKDSTTMYFRYYDANYNFIGKFDADHQGNFYPNSLSSVRKMPNDCSYLRFYVDESVYEGDICINLSWSGYRDGEYEAHKERVYSLDVSLELRGIPKFDAANRLYYDGDTYESDGTVKRRYGIVDLGTLTWTKNGGTSNQFYSSQLSRPGIDASATLFNRVSRRYTVSATAYNAPVPTLPVIICKGSRIWINDPDYTEDDRLTQDLSGIYYLYELATPTTEEAEPFTSPQWVNDFGTEEYVDYGVQQGDRDVSIPVGHNTKYLQNLRDKLQHLPNLPDPLEDGDYKIHVSGHQMSLIPDGGVVNVHLTYDSINENYRSDLTVGEISELIQNGMRVHLLFEIPDYYPGFEYNAPVGLVVKSNETYDPERTLYELMAQIVDPQSRYIVLLDTMGVTSDETQWYMRLYPLGCTDVVFDGTYNSSTGNFSWDCDATNAEIVNLLDKYGSVRAKIYIDLMNDTYMYFTQCTVQNDLVQFCGIATLPNNGANQLSYIQLHQSSEDTWVSTITPLQ